MYFKPQQSTEPVIVERSQVMVITLTSAIVIAIGVVPGIVAEMFRF
jgi:hypothetical protein